MSESQAIQSIMNAELEVYRQKGRVLELEANNAALRLKVQALEEWKRIVTGAGTDQESVIRLAATENTQAAVQCWRDANAQLQERLDQRLQGVKALPTYKNITVIHRIDENDYESWHIWANHNPLVECDTEEEVNALAALLTHRQGMGG